MIALKCLQKPTELRYAAADELAADLEAYLADEPISARSSQLHANHDAGVSRNAPRQRAGKLGPALDAARRRAAGPVPRHQRVSTSGVTSRWPYFALWTVGLGAWAAIFWNLAAAAARSRSSNGKSPTSGPAA